MAGIRKSETCCDCRDMIVQTRTVKPKPGVRTYKRCEDCRRTSVILRLRVRHTRRLLDDLVSKPVRYYSDGWRCGYLISIGASRASIQPIGAMSGICPNVVTIPISDVKPEEAAAIKMPTVEDYYAMTKKMPVLVAQPARVVEIKRALKVGAGVFTGDLINELATLDVQETPVSTEREQTKTVNRTKHAPIDFAEAQRLYLLGTRMSAIVEAVRGNRAAGGCANDVRNHL